MDYLIIFLSCLSMAAWRFLQVRQETAGISNRIFKAGRLTELKKGVAHHTLPGHGGPAANDLFRSRVWLLREAGKEQSGVGLGGP